MEYEEALLLAQKIDYRKGIADANTFLGIYYSYRGENVKTEQFLSNALEVYNILDCQCSYHLKALEGMSILTEEENRHDDAMQYAIKLSELSKLFGTDKDIIKQNTTWLYLRQYLLP